MIIAFFDILYFLILIRIILSFLPVNPYGNPTVFNAVQFIRNLTEPFLLPFRRVIPPISLGGGAFDLSPIFALIVLRLIRNFLLGLI